MLKHLLATAALLVTLDSSSFAQTATGSGTTDQPPTADATKQPDTAAGPSETASDPAPQGEEPTAADRMTGKTHTGGVTSTAREILPTPSQEDGAPTAAAPAEAGDTAAATGGEMPDAGSATPSGSVSPEVLQEIREMAIEAEKAAAIPTPEKSDEQAAAEKKAIETHRDGLFARAEQERQN